MEHRKCLESKKQFRNQSSTEVFREITRGPRFFLESSNDRNTGTIESPKVRHVFDYFVVIDFEVTCDKGKIPHPQEIIEFPSVIMSGVTGEIESCFRTYVRPTHNQILTDFCKDLAGIQQDQVDNGVTLEEALLMHDEWLEINGI
ncbi:uncharacterized protein LOC133297789 [Gastrolobium bilobum]|uniref:uncharacterized protein LOC133297789 n=1 Tax=Gastrolobium bilobum TaxID=150636 RepID=UPI002AB09521|nr:uncharacterized protein LOC133297789 [Gastrolobium bilobum]